MNVPAHLVATMSAAAGGDDTGVLLRSFLIAVVLMAPVALWQWRRIQAGRAESEAESEAGSEPKTTTGAGSQPGSGDPPRLEDLVARIHELAGSTPTGGEATFEIPPRTTLHGSPVEPSVATTLVADALRRSGWETRQSPTTTRWICRRT